MEVMGKSYMPGDPRLVEQLVYELKSQGIFDQFRRECIADVDTKPAYQNLRQRVEGSVTSFLKQQTWRPDMIKNQLREQLRKNIHESGYLEAGVERIVEQVVNPKINTVILPQVEDVAYRFLGIEKPVRNSIKKELEITISDLLPKDLEAVSPDSVHSFKFDKRIGDGENINQDSNLKAEDDESPPFELLIESNIKQESHHLEDNSVDSHLSGFSGLQSHESSHCGDVKLQPSDMSYMDYQVSQNDSEGRLPNIVSDEVIKMDICEDSLSHNDKSEASETKFDLMDVEKSEDNDEITDDKNISNDFSNDTREGEKNFDDKLVIKEVKRDDKILIFDKKNDKSSDEKSSKYVSKDKNDKYYKSSSKSKSSKDNGSSRDKYKKDSKSSSSSTKEKDQRDKSRDKYKEKSNKSDRHTKERSSKDDYNKSKHTFERAKGDKIKVKSDKERDKSGKEIEQDKDKKKSDHHKDKYDKGKVETEKNRERNKNSDKLPKDVDKSSKLKEKLEKEMDKIDLEKTNEKGEKDQENMSRSEGKCEEKSDKSNSCKEEEESGDKTELQMSKGKSEKDQEKGEDKLKEKSGRDDWCKERERDKDRFSKGRSTKENDSSDKSKKDKDIDSSEKSKKYKEIDKDKSKSSSSKHKSGSSSKREGSGTSSSANKSRSSSSSAKEKLKTGDHDKSSNKSKSSGDKNTANEKNSSLKKDGDRKRDPKKQSKDDHYGSKDKKYDRRSTDRDSNDGNSNRNNSTNSFTESSSSCMDRNDKEFSSSSGPVDSGNSDEVEPSSDSLKIDETMTNEEPQIKLTKPNFASNFQEARKLMKIRKELLKLERQDQLNKSLTDNVGEGLVNSNMQDNSENLHQSELPSESEDEKSFMTMSGQPLKLTKPKFASNYQEAKKLMKIRRQLAKLEKQNMLGISSDLETGDQEHFSMNPVHAGNTSEPHSEQTESSLEPLAGMNAEKPFKINKPKFASNFKEAINLMKIRRQLAKLERQSQHNISANMLNIPGTSGDSENINKIISESQPVKLNKPKFASNFREATKLMKIRKQLTKLEQEKKLGFAEVSGPTEDSMCKADTDSNLPNGENLTDQALINNEETSIHEPLKGTELSQENWEALEARLAQEMSNINYNCYDEPCEYDDTGTSATNSSPIKSREIKKNTSENIQISSKELSSEDSQNDSMEFKGFKLEDNESNPTDFFKSYFGGDPQNSKITGGTVPDIEIDKVLTSNEHGAAKNKLNNNFKQLSVILDIKAFRNMNTEVEKETQIKHSNDECRYLEQQNPNIEKKLQYLRDFIGMLERKIGHCKTELQNNVHQARGQKRKFDECVDIRNNNKAYFEQTTVKKRGRPPGSNSDRAKAVKMCNTSDILQNNSFPLPLSPAESDKSNDKKEEEIVVPAKQRRIANRASQRYSSEDLYKPRSVICRRSRAAKNNT